MSDRSEDDGRHAASAPLVAWYVNDTLAPGERAEVESHLATCAECRTQAEFWRQLAPFVAATGAAPAPHPSQFGRLVARLDEEIDAPPAAPGDARFRRLPRRWRWVVAAQAAAIALLVGGLFLAAGQEPRVAPFRTLAAPAAPPAALHLRVVFDEGASERELRALLVPLGATIVGGPSPLGVYTVALPAGAAPAEAAAALRARPIVRFAEPVAP
ncbi:MAG TPA: zf-HC2 domain-containing protein [Thermoanaerobaculia bacterium]